MSLIDLQALRAYLALYRSLAAPVSDPHNKTKLRKELERMMLEAN